MLEPCSNFPTSSPGKSFNLSNRSPALRIACWNRSSNPSSPFNAKLAAKHEEERPAPNILLVWYMPSRRLASPARIAPNGAPKYLYNETYTVSNRPAYSITGTPVAADIM